MNAQTRTIAENCLKASYGGTMSFPETVGTLIGAGFESYVVDYRRNTTTYYLADGDSVVLEGEKTAGTVAENFNATGVETAVREAQANLAGYTYRGFCETVKSHGCAGYFVSFPGRRAVYFGRTAETHVEHFPQ
jgi:uncharacterized protein YbcV (DUF1398 family)